MTIVFMSLVAGVLAATDHVTSEPAVLTVSGTTVQMTYSVAGQLKVYCSFGSGGR